MKISLNWVGDYVDISDLSADKVAELLSLHTAEVEGVEHYGDSIADVVVGEVVECGPHPEADKLSLTQVAYGGEETVPVVCGASNVRKGLKVAFAPVGAVLPGDFKIKKAKLRGQVSMGMICSERELELSDEHAGILELADDAEIGQRLIAHLGIADSVLELDNKSLTHRPDLWGHYGFARELAAILDRPLKPMELSMDWPETAGDWSIELQDTDGCPRYGAVEVDLGGVPQPSPAWIQHRLKAVDQRPVNDVVDVTNYVLLDLGQPTHAFDAERLRGGRIVVRAAEAGERFTTLDEVQRELQEQDLVIADGERSVALAGVMGGLETEVTDATERILLESAVFHPTRIRRTAQRLALRSEASTRFEKSLDPAYADQATARFCRLLLDLRPQAKVLSAPKVEGQASAPDRQLELDAGRCAKLLGIEMDAAAVTSSLSRLGFGVEGEGDRLQVQVPSWRASKDVTQAIDLVEEVGRLHGYDRIQPEPLNAPIQVPQQQPLRRLGHRMIERLVMVHGAHETQSYSFLHREWAARLGLEEADFVGVRNPVQADVVLMRRDPVPALLLQARDNLKERASGRLCEVAKGYEPLPGEPRERRWLCLLEWAEGEDGDDGQESLFGRLKGLAEDLFTVLGRPQLQARTGVADELPAWAHPVLHQSLHHGGEELAVLARIHPHLLHQLGFEHSIAGVLLVDLEVAAARMGLARFQPPSRFPGIKVDVALALPEAVPYAEVEMALRRAGGKFLQELELFDVYRGSGLEEGHRSLAFRCLLQSPERTLSDKEERKFLKGAARVATELGGNLRS